MARRDFQDYTGEPPTYVRRGERANQVSTDWRFLGWLGLFTLAVIAATLVVAVDAMGGIPERCQRTYPAQPTTTVVLPSDVPITYPTAPAGAGLVRCIQLEQPEHPVRVPGRWGVA